MSGRGVISDTHAPVSGLIDVLLFRNVPRFLQAVTDGSFRESIVLSLALSLRLIFLPSWFFPSSVRLISVCLSAYLH